MYKLSRTLLMVAVIISLVFIGGAVQAFWPHSALVLVVLVLAALGRKGYARLTTLGSARWAEWNDLRWAGMLNARSGLILGRLPASPRFRLFIAIASLFRGRIGAREACEGVISAFRRARGDLVRLSNAIHIAVFSPSGGGKGVCCVLPFLKTCDESVVVIDFKGENARLTAAHRETHFGHKAILLDPYHAVTSDPDTFNPLDFIDKENPIAIDECNELSKALVVRTGEEKDPHFNDAAEMFIAGITAMVVQYGDPADGTRSLQTVREILSNPQKLELAIKVMVESKAWDGILARLGGQLMHFVDKEKSSALTTAGRHLRFLDSLPVVECTKQSSFDPAALRKGKLTIYLILPPNQMQTQAPLLRLWITSFFRCVVAGGLQEKRRVHYVLDEAASLGHLEAVSDAVDKYRGFGIRLQFYFQSMGQLKKCWPNGQDQTLLSNTTQVFFGVNDQAVGTGGTADYVSARLGEQTIIVDSGGSSSSRSHSTSSGPKQGGGGSTTYSHTSNSNWQQQARKLLKPEEVVALPPRTAITFTPGVRPINTTLLRHYEEPRLGVRPGRLGRMLAALGTLAASAVISIWFVFVAFGLNVMAHDLRAARRPSPQSSFHARTHQPGVPVERHALP
jgi:type IV secretion system protein VirD4